MSKFKLERVKARVCPRSLIGNMIRTVKPYSFPSLGSTRFGVILLKGLKWCIITDRGRKPELGNFCGHTISFNIKYRFNAFSLRSKYTCTYPVEGISK